VEQGWNDTRVRWNKTGARVPPSFFIFENMTRVSFHLFHFFGGLVPPLHTPQPLDFMGFSFSTGTSGTTGTMILRNRQIRLYNDIKLLYIALFEGFIKSAFHLFHLFHPLKIMA